MLAMEPGEGGSNGTGHVSHSICVSWDCFYDYHSVQEARAWSWGNHTPRQASCSMNTEPQTPDGLSMESGNSPALPDPFPALNAASGHSHCSCSLHGEDLTITIHIKTGPLPFQFTEEFKGQFSSTWVPGSSSTAFQVLSLCSDTPTPSAPVLFLLPRDGARDPHISTYLDNLCLFDQTQPVNLFPTKTRWQRQGVHVCPWKITLLVAPRFSLLV